MRSRLVRRLDSLIRASTKEVRFLFTSARPKKILFDHLPKCGGSSLTAYLEAHYPRREIFRIDGVNPAASIEDFKALPLSKRYRYNLVTGHLANALLEHIHPETVRVTLLREPIDRVVSHYYYVKRNRTHYLHAKVVESNLSLEEYVASNLSGGLHNWYTAHFSGRSVSEAERNPAESVQRAVDGLVGRYDIVGFLDDFASFIETLRARAQLRSDRRLERVNVTKDRPSLQQIPRSTIEEIKRVNFLDIAFYKRAREEIG